MDRACCPACRPRGVSCRSRDLPPSLWSGPDGELLQLWDTPGFGDSVRLFKRLRLAGNPLGWFLREVVDRYRERPFWLSQQAMRTAREAADAFTAPAA